MPTKTPPAWFPWYPRDFRLSEKVMRLSPAGRGIYVMLLCAQWEHETLPSDIGALARLADCSVEELESEWPVLSECFTLSRDGKRAFNARLKQIRKQTSETSRKRSVAGKLGGSKGLGASKCLASVKQKPSESESESDTDNRVVPDGPGTARNGSQPWEPKHPRTDDLCRFLARGIREWKPDAKVDSVTRSKSSREGMDGLVRIDGRDPERVEELIVWLYGGERSDYQPRPGSDFDWRANIRSGAKLRAQWDVLEDLAVKTGGLKP